MQTIKNTFSVTSAESKRRSNQVKEEATNLVDFTVCTARNIRIVELTE